MNYQLLASKKEPPIYPMILENRFCVRILQLAEWNWTEWLTTYYSRATPSSDRLLMTGGGGSPSLPPVQANTSIWYRWVPPSQWTGHSQRWSVWDRQTNGWDQACEHICTNANYTFKWCSFVETELNKLLDKITRWISNFPSRPGFSHFREYADLEIARSLAGNESNKTYVISYLPYIAFCYFYTIWLLKSWRFSLILFPNLSDLQVIVKRSLIFWILYIFKHTRSMFHSNGLVFAHRAPQIRNRTSSSTWNHLFFDINLSIVACP